MTCINISKNQFYFKIVTILKTRNYIMMFALVEMQCGMIRQGIIKKTLKVMLSGNVQNLCEDRGVQKLVWIKEDNIFLNRKTETTMLLILLKTISAINAFLVKMPMRLMYFFKKMTKLC